MFNMRNSAFTTVFLIAILLTGAITTASVSFIDTEASSDKKEKKKDKDRDRDYEREYDKKEQKKDKDYERDYEREDKYVSYEEYDEDKSDKYDGKDKDSDYKEKSDKYNEEYDKPQKELYKSYPKQYNEEYDKPQKELYKSYPKQYSEDYDVKSNKKIKIIDCNNLNVNADELEDLQSIQPSIQEAIASNGEEEQQLGSYNEFSHDNPNTRVYYIDPNTKVIFKCNNANHNLIENENADVSDSTATTDGSVQTETFAAATENNNASVNNSTESIETSQSGNMTNDTNSTMQASSPLEMESSDIPTFPPNAETASMTSKVPFIFPIPNTID
jgi:hypothetical protein